MEKQSLFSKIYHAIINFFKIAILGIISVFKNLFGKNTPEEEAKKTAEQLKQEIKKEEVTKPNGTATTLPDEDNMKTNPHDGTPNSNIVLTLSKDKDIKIKRTPEEEFKLLYTFEHLQEMIEERLEKKYEYTTMFKMKYATKDEKEKILEMEKKIIPKLIEKINKNILVTNDEVKKQIEKDVDDYMKEKPIFPDITVTTSVELPKLKEDKKKEPEKEIYFIAHPRQKELNLEVSIPQKTSAKPLLENGEKEVITEEIEKSPIRMVQNGDEIPTPTLKDNLKEAAIASTIVAADITRSFISSSDNKDIEKKDSNKEEKHEEQTKDTAKPTIEDVVPIIEAQAEIEATMAIPEVTEEAISYEEISVIKDELEKKIEKIKDEKEKKEISEKKDDAIQELVKDKEITDMTQTGEAIIEDSIIEIKKEDFDDKDYERIERQIDKMLEDITNTYLKYEGKMSKRQREKLKAEERRLRETRDQIQAQKSHDIRAEITSLEESIQESEISGLQAELKRIDAENKAEASNTLFHKMEHLEGMTREQVENVDKRIMLKRFNKASTLLEMSSILALPFVRNKYFFYFTIGLIVDNHFNFINAFWKRKINEYEPVDLSSIKKGQDALDGALDITYKNMVELDYLEQQALARYPDLQYDPAFVSQVTHLRTTLAKNYNKLMNKNKKMEKYKTRTKKQHKVLKKDLKKEENNR